MVTHTCFYPDNLVVFEAVEEHRASNVNVVEQRERLPDVRRWDLVRFCRQSHRPLKGHGSHLEAYNGFGRQRLVSKEEARQGITRATAFMDNPP